MILTIITISTSGELKTFDRDFSNVQQLFAEIHTHEGVIEIELFYKDAPNTVANFEFLVGSGYYNGVIFHRIIQDFMIQTGDSTGTGRGIVGYNIKDEINALQHETGSVSMANTGRINSGAAQFFITQQPQKHLNGKHTVFGRVIKGMNVVNLIEKGDPILKIKLREINIGLKS